MKRTFVFLLLGVPLGAACVIFTLSRAGTLPADPVAGATPAAALDRPRIVAGPGRVEPISEEIRISAAVSGKLQTVAVEEGDRVAAGQVIAQIENDDYRARVTAAEATLRQREAELRRVVNGARDHERREALAAVRAAEAVMANARLEAVRRRELATDGTVSREEADRHERDLRVAQARYDEAVQHHAAIDVEAREEDRSRAAAATALARARLDEARAQLDRTYVRSSVSGVVLRKYRKAGESVSTQFDSPILIVADDSRLRVRIDVDETDVGRIRVGQRAYVTADAFPSRKFWGRVVRVGRLLGKKNIRTDEPTERVDTKVLETLVGLDDGHELPLGLRVDAFVVLDPVHPAQPGLRDGPSGRDTQPPSAVTAAATRYWVQVGAFRDRPTATRLAERLRARKLPVSDRPVGTAVAAEGEPLARVLVGPFADRHTAIVTLRDLRAEGFEPFIAEERN